MGGARMAVGGSSDWSAPEAVSSPAVGRSNAWRAHGPVRRCFRSVCWWWRWVAGVWEFSTSGLEMSMVFLWLGVSFLLLVRLEERRRRAVPAAVVIGLGTLIRPELALGSVVFMIALVAVIAAPGWSGRPRRLARYGLPIASAVALPFSSRSSAPATTPCWSPTPRWPSRRCRLVVPGVHLPVELRGSLHVVVAPGTGGPLGRRPGTLLVAAG